MEFTDLIKFYGPMAPIIFFFYMGYKSHLDTNRADIESRIKMANALDKLSAIIMERVK